MSAALLSSADSFVAFLSEFEPRRYSGEDCVALVERLARIEKMCATARVRAAARAASCGAHREQGFRNPADWLARRSGTTSAAAERDLDTANRLDDLPFTKDALVNGEISLAEAEEAKKTDEQCPGAECDIVAEAKANGLRAARDKGRATRLATIDPNELHRQQRAARFHRHWRDELGMIRYSGAMMPADGVSFMHRLDAETDREFRAAHREGRVEARECYAADAFARLVRGEGKGRAATADVVFVCDVATGSAHIVGGGPVPMAVVREAAKDAFVKAVLHDGVKVDTIVHYGRKAPPVHVRTVLELGDPPRFDGVRCVDCGAEFGIEWDHRDPVANGGPTCASNFDPRCRRCHDEKTERDRLAGLLGRPP